MNKAVLICCFLVLMFSSVANAAISSDLYGSYTGTVTMGGESTAMTVVLGDDQDELSLEMDDFYLWTPADTDSWATTWLDGEKDENLFEAESTSSNSISYTNTGEDWKTTLFLLFNSDGTITLSGTQEEGADSVSISGTFTRATPIPGAVWLLGSGIAGLVGLRRKYAV